MGAQGALAGASLASALLGGIFAPEGQELQSFAGGENDPGKILSQARLGLEDFLKFAVADANKPVSVDTTVAPLPIFTGGGLPFNIAAPALDPARLNSERRSLPGLDLSPRIGESDRRGPGGAPTLPAPGDDDPIDGPNFPDQTTPGDPGFPDQLAQTEQSAFGATDAAGGEGGDMDQAVGAVELLMAQLQPKVPSLQRRQAA